MIPDLALCILPLANSALVNALTDYMVVTSVKKLVTRVELVRGTVSPKGTAHHLMNAAFDYILHNTSRVHLCHWMMGCVLWRLR